MRYWSSGAVVFNAVIVGTALFLLPILPLAAYGPVGLAIAIPAWILAICWFLFWATR